MIRLVPGVLGITDDIVIHGATENTHDGTVLVLCKTEQPILELLRRCSSSLQTVNSLGTDITVDPKKIEAIIQMDPPQNVANLQSFNGMVNYLKKFSPVLSELSEPLRRLCKS